MTQRRWALVLFALVALFGAVVFAALFDWNWLRGPLERFASDKLQREVRIGALEGRVGLTPVIRLRDLSVANAAWAQDEPPMARAREIEVSVRLLSLLTGKVVLPQLRLTDADLALQRLADGRANWDFAPRDEPDQPPQPPPAEVQALRIDAARLTYRDAQLDIEAQAQVQTRTHETHPTDISFSGRARGSSFKGHAQAGSVLAVRSGGPPFPLRLEMTVAGTSVRFDGEVTDLATLERVEADFAISGPSIGNLYPTLRIALPASPPYKLRGQLRKEGNRYGYSRFSGTVGDSDIAGDGEFILGEPRPKLTATLRSQQLRIADLGPMIGVEQRAAERATRPPGTSGQPTASRPAATRAKPTAPKAPRETKAKATPTRSAVPPTERPRGMPIPPPDPPGARGRMSLESGPQWMKQLVAPVSAQRTELPASTRKAAATRAPAAAPNPDAAADPPTTTRDGRPLNAPPRLLPDVDIDVERLRAIDADVRIEIQSLLLPAQLTFREVSSRVLLQDARLRVQPVRFRFAGGEVESSLQLDGTREPAAAKLSMNMRRLSLPELFAAVPPMKASAGRIGARIELQGSGLSVADVLGQANGSMAMGMEGGRISRLALAAASLNGARLLQLLIGGDENTPIRCMGMSMQFKSGIGDIESFVLDTRDVVVYGDGLVNLQLEVFDLVFEPRPKEASVLSLRGPVHARGSFRGAQISLDPKTVIRGGAALALGAINPLAALLPLIETGPGEDSDCREVLK